MAKKKVTHVKVASKGEPQTMEEALALYSTPTFSFTIGDIVKGKVIRKEKGRLLIDIGGKSEGLVAEKAYKEAEDYIESLNIGDMVEGRVIVSETSDGYTVVSLRNAVQNTAWDKVKKLYDSGDPVSVRGKALNASGVTVELYNLIGFIPMSQIGKTASKNSQGLVGKHFDAAVIDFDRENKKIILSEKEVSEKEEIEQIKKALKKINVGDEFEGKIVGIYDFGCFVQINAKFGEKVETVAVEGLVHISELSWDKTEYISDLWSEGDKVKVKVIGKKNDKLALSIKQAGIDPWVDIDKKYKKEAKVSGTITRVSDFGVFVQLEPGVEGLLHITKIPPGRKLVKGSKVDVYIDEVDSSARKISLGLVLTEKPVGYK